MLHSARPRFPTAGPRYVTPIRSEAIWASVWPFAITSSIAVLMLIFSQAIWLLEAASLSKGTDKALFGNTASTGAGLWCGFFFFIAAFVILAISAFCIEKRRAVNELYSIFFHSIDFVYRTHLWAIISFVLTIVAWSFSAILIGLDAKAVKDGKQSTTNLTDKAKILAAQLAFACLVNVLCLLFIIIYIIIHFRAQDRINQEKLGRYVIRQN